MSHIRVTARTPGATACRGQMAVDEILALTLAVSAALTFPLVAIVIHRRRERRHNRRMGVRRTDKIKL